MTFLDLMTNMTGAVMILMLFAMIDAGKKVCPSIPHSGRIVFDPETGKFTGEIEHRGQAVENGDSILVAVTGFQPFPKPGEVPQCPPCTLPHGGKPCDRNHCPDPDRHKLQDPGPPKECSIALSTQVSGCEGNDTYTVRVSVTKVGGACATAWTDGKGTWAYGSEAKFGPYAIAEGNKTITVWDSQNTGMRRTVTVMPPPKCSGGGGNSQVVVVEQNKVGYVPPGRRVILFWENEASNIDIIVEKYGGGKIRGGQNDKSWGEWYRDKAKWMGRRSTEEGVKIYTTGRYTIYAKNKTGRSGPALQKVKLALTNSIGTRESQEYDFDVSKDSDELLLAEIEIAERGIKIIKIINIKK